MVASKVRSLALLIVAASLSCGGDAPEEVATAGAGGGGIAAGRSGGASAGASAAGAGGAVTPSGTNAGSRGDAGAAGAPGGGAGSADAADAGRDARADGGRMPRAADRDYDPVALAKLRLPPATSDQIARALASLDQRFMKAQFRGSNGVELPYRLHVPDRASYHDSAPLIVFMHGSAQRGYDNRSQVIDGFIDGLGTLADGERAKQLPAFILAPQCPPTDHWDAVATTTPKELRFSLVPRPALAAAKQLVDQIIETHPTIDRRRIYVTGLSMGGFATWELMSRWPDVFAAGVPMCSGGDPSYVDRLTSMPIWVFHSTDDGNVPVAWDDTIVAALIAKGGHPRFSRLSGYGHAVWTAAWREPELFPWLFLQSQ